MLAGKTWIFCLVVFVQHIAAQSDDDDENKRRIAHRPSHLSLEVIFEPLKINCSVPMCKGSLSHIYCYGDILTAAWQFGLQKTCPGDKLRKQPSDVLDAFSHLSYPLTKTVFQQFCEENFEITTYLEPTSLADWEVEPEFLKSVKDAEYKKLAKALHEKWSFLARKVQRRVFVSRELFPIIPVRNPFIVPGGRFDIYFYWDTYWIVKGLLVSGMKKTVAGIIENFADIVDEVGFIPNSGNIQLSRRTQPPLFIHMVYDYYNATGDTQSLKKWINAMETEITFWYQNRTIDLDSGQLFQYRAETDCPRPENLLGDYELAINSSEPTKSWRAIASACESGWDFSSRWMDRTASRISDPSTIHTDDIVPVDLNVFMARNMLYMSQFYKILGNATASAIYQKRFELLRDTLHKTFWVDKIGAWFDYDLSTKSNNLFFYPSNVFPLLLSGLEQYADQIASYVRSTGALDFKGGVPTTLNSTSYEQWDFPNVWAPNQHLVIEAFRATNNSFLKESADDQTTKFILAVYNGLFNPPKGKIGTIWEKYDARSTTGTSGGGGEYEVQEGFGWTNGAVLDMIWNSRAIPEDKSYPFFDSVTQAVVVIGAWTLSALVAICYLLRICCSKKSSNQRDSDDRQASRGLLDDDDEDLS